MIRIVVLFHLIGRLHKGQPVLQSRCQVKPLNLLIDLWLLFGNHRIMILDISDVDIRAICKGHSET